MGEKPSRLANFGYLGHMWELYAMWAWMPLFLLGVLTKRGNFHGWLVGLAVSVPATLWLQKGIEAHWIYYFPFSFFIAFGTALLASRFFKVEPKA